MQKGKQLVIWKFQKYPRLDKWKIFIPRANNIGTELNDDNLNAFIAEPNEICTESYLVVGAELELDKYMCENLQNYLKLRFVRFCHSIAKTSQDATSKTFRFVPLPNLSKSWTDDELYLKYELTKEEIVFIESMIKPMDQ